MTTSENYYWLIGDSSTDYCKVCIILPNQLNLYRIVQEAVNNAIKHGKAKNISMQIAQGKSKINITIQDDGRGIPVEKHASGRSALDVVMTVLHAGGKFDNKSYKVSGGLHGVGVSVVNALSEKMTVEVYTKGKIYKQSYIRINWGENMVEISQIYKCMVCGNIVEVVNAGGGTLVCCNQPMKLM